MPLSLLPLRLTGIALEPEKFLHGKLEPYVIARACESSVTPAATECTNRVVSLVSATMAHGNCRSPAVPKITLRCCRCWHMELLLRTSPLDKAGYHSLRRSKPARATIPVPNSTMLLGSGLYWPETVKDSEGIVPITPES